MFFFWHCCRRQSWYHTRFLCTLWHGVMQLLSKYVSSPLPLLIGICQPLEAVWVICNYANFSSNLCKWNGITQKADHLIASCCLPWLISRSKRWVFFPTLVCERRSQLVVHPWVCDEEALSPGAQCWVWERRARQMWSSGP